ncbi:hypothetical protein BU26DRAFT_558227 [Trematosphaeria pertusa]|uniref:C2H2-type domain-containing protein n=1 Tax=Trematosphaeria pertusa TaxID=390896 RepID=A0A6A6J4K1_9PLEO|nr:uncharacterized protein BU26DRAFT_558227 [Trematosphaeria pertusa]KAF2256790.1 hypothetical protein BU26DRAFT_558227 [Trematosphaeria pertusa]
MSGSWGSWEESDYASFLLWDIDREFQNAYEAYEQWLARNRRRRSAWQCITGSTQEDALGKALSLGRHVQKLIDDGKEAFGSRFERGDSSCHTILSAQLQRLQHEITVPLLDCAHARIRFPIPYDDILRAAKGVRRACFYALRDQYTRLQSPTSAPFLPPPRFSVKFCPFALQLKKDQRRGHQSNIQARKVRPHDRYDEREICPYCNVHICVSAHSGLPNYRRLLFQSHVSQPSANNNERATFACSSCYKTFDDSYAFLDHVFQKEIGSERSCLRRYSLRFSLSDMSLLSDPALMEKCLRNCLHREITRARALKKSKELEA